MSGPGHNSFDPDRIAQELSERGMAWADADAAYRALDDVTKSVLSECCIDSGEKSSAAQETVARTADKFRRHLSALADARRAANRARARLDTYRAWIELKRSEQATQRAEMQIR